MDERNQDMRSTVNGSHRSARGKARWSAVQEYLWRPVMSTITGHAIHARLCVCVCFLLILCAFAFCPSTFPHCASFVRRLARLGA